MATAIREASADTLIASLQQFARATGETSTLLTGLDSRLAHLTQLTAPIASHVTSLILADGNITAVQAAADELLRALDTSRKVEAQLRPGPSQDLKTFLEQLSRLEKAMAALHQHAKLASARTAYDHALQVHAKAMADCEADFQSHLGHKAAAAGLPSASWLREQAVTRLAEAVAEGPQLGAFPAATLERLSALAAAMLSADHHGVLDAYVQARTRHIDNLMRLAGFEPLPSGAVLTRVGEQLEKAAASWTLQLRVLVLVAANELALARAVWQPPYDGKMSSEVISRSLQLLLQAGRDIVEGRRPPDHVFALLEMHRHLAEVLPLLEPLLASSEEDSIAAREWGADATSTSRQRADTRRSPARGRALVRELRALGTALVWSARTVFADFEDAVAKDQSRVQVLDGTIHPLCAHTLSYLKRLFTFQNSGQVLFSLPAASEACPPGRLSPSGRGTGHGGGTRDEAQPLARASAQLRAASGAILRIMTGLADNLEAKSQAYKDLALARLFLMNNTHFLVAAVEAPGGGVLYNALGPGWLDDQRDVVETLGDEYHRLTWMPLVTQLQNAVADDEALRSNVAKFKLWLKDQFNVFNASLETIYTTQCAWTIPDPKLRAAVRRITRRDVVPAYTRFWKKFASVDFTSTPAKYLRYTPEDVEAMIDTDLFEGQLVTLQKVKMKKQRAVLGA